MNDIISGILANSGFALLGFLSGWIYRRYRIASKKSKILDFWRPFVENEGIVVVGRSLELNYEDPAGFFSVGDAMALSQIQQLLERNSLPQIRFRYADELTGDLLSNNLLLIGGPGFNAITKEVLDRIRAKAVFDDVCIREQDSGEIFLPDMDRDFGNCSSDYSLVLRGESPFNSAYEVLVLAGVHGYGTWAASSFLCSARFLKDWSYARMSASRTFELVLRTDVALQVPQASKVVWTRHPNWPIEKENSDE